MAFTARNTPSFTSSAGRTFKQSNLGFLSQFNRDVFSFSDKRVVKVYHEIKTYFIFACEEIFKKTIV